MSIFDKAKELSERVTEKSNDFSSDEAIANMIIKAVNKQEKVNAILEKKEANYRICDIDLSMSIPPAIIFGIRRLDDKKRSSENTL